MTLDTVLFPHCDLHAVLDGPALRLRVMFRVGPSMQDVTGQAQIAFFAPHKPVGQRLTNLPQFDASTGGISGGDPGVYLFQLRSSNNFLVGRLQVHQRVSSWWFGNESMTTAVDDTYFHAQPSLYAKFSDDHAGADLIGDITGHGWVTLTSSDTAAFVVNDDGRLRGLTETRGTPASLHGDFGGHAADLPVRVVDYRLPRNDLYPIQVTDLAGAADRHNLVFVSEGFRDTDADRALFDKVVTQVARDMFDKPRHQPFALVEGSFNVFKAFVPSQQHLITTSFRVTDPGASAPQAIPSDDATRPGKYTLNELVGIVGLPPSGEGRSPDDLTHLWQAQGLTGFDATKVDGPLIEAWKVHQGVGILDARDTYFGLQLGFRLADRSSVNQTLQEAAAPVPASDVVDDRMRHFIAQLYRFYPSAGSHREITPDPRRHPPELYTDGDPSLGISIFHYLEGLTYHYAPYPRIGAEWVPQPNTFTRSRGLVVMVVHDGLQGGTSFNGQTLTALTLNSLQRLATVYTDPANPGERRRNPPAEIPIDIPHTIDTIVHEVGHSFNLGDEYEDFGGVFGDPTQMSDTPDSDNLARLRLIRSGPAPTDGTADGRSIDPSLVKWFELPRMDLSAALATPSAVTTDGLTVTIDPRDIGAWVRAKAAGTKTYLRNARFAANGAQLPLAAGETELLSDLDLGDINETDATIVLSGQELPSPIPTFGAGSLLFVPKRDSGGAAVTVVDKLVTAFIGGTRQPLNIDPDVTKPNKDADTPVAIPGVTPPCKPYKLVGIYEGGGQVAGGTYRPTGACKMRDAFADDAGGEFCFVCKWLIVNRVDPARHMILDRAFYPRPKSCCCG